jgi:hypothetical protein
MNYLLYHNPPIHNYSDHHLHSSNFFIRQIEGLSQRRYQCIHIPIDEIYEAHLLARFDNFGIGILNGYLQTVN